MCSTKKIDVVRSLGADHIIDYTKEDFTRSGEQYDLIIDAAGSHSLNEFARSLRPTGRYVFVGGPTSRFMTAVLLGPVFSMMGRKRFTAFLLNPDRDDLNHVIDLLESGDVVPVIDQRYRLNEVPDAIRYLEDGRATGKVIVS